MSRGEFGIARRWDPDIITRTSRRSTLAVLLAALSIFAAVRWAEAEKRAAQVVGYSTYTKLDHRQNNDAAPVAYAYVASACRLNDLNSAAARAAPHSVVLAESTTTPSPTAPGSEYNLPQRVVLYEEDPSDPKTPHYVGSVLWRTDQISAPGEPEDVAVHADIEVPARRLKMTLSFRRNRDQSLPASHALELTFQLPPDFVGGDVSDVPGMLMKSNESARGTALAASAVKIAEGAFRLGLSNEDRLRNLRLLSERPWMDIPMVYGDKRRAIIAIEKGASGDKAFKAAFAAWGQTLPTATPTPQHPQETHEDLSGRGGGFVVQLSSQRSEEDALASYRALQSKFPDVLGMRAPIIKRADLGSKHVYYRAVAGPFDTGEEASLFCDSLRTAGGYCIVQRNY
jgi:hypothetical protein